MKASNHAHRRWMERFPRLEMAQEYAVSQPLGQRRKRQMGIAQWRSARLSRSGAIFVVDGGVIVTVLNLPRHIR